jgi:conjugative relaxase-like TrwC/TraI family protein
VYHERPFDPFRLRFIAHRKSVGPVTQKRIAIESHPLAGELLAVLPEPFLFRHTDRSTGNLAIAVYHHDTSRELDPQLHTHVVAANLTYDGTEARWKALQASGIYERRAYLTEVYRNSLAREVKSLGYEIDNRRDAKGRDYGFEIRGISDALLEKFSQRSRQRDEAIEAFTLENGRKPTDNEVAVLVRESRADKLTEISTDAVRARQLQRLTTAESQELSGINRQGTN